jgi:hypothetical protein
VTLVGPKRAARRSVYGVATYDGMMTIPQVVSFKGGTAGEWSVVQINAVRGAALPVVSRLSVIEGVKVEPDSAGWVLRATTSSERYVERAERYVLVERQEGLGRADASWAALIPITKSSGWWELTQDERRAVFEARSAHIAVGLQYLPAIARRLHHGRDLGEEFDFLTWFEYRSTDANAFEELVGRLRETEEWSYVEREVDIRLRR